MDVCERTVLRSASGRAFSLTQNLRFYSSCHAGYRHPETMKMRSSREYTEGRSGWDEVGTELVLAARIQV